MTVQRLYRGQEATILTKYEIGGRSYGFDELKRKFFSGARGILNNPVVDGYIRDGKYLIDSWEHYDSEDALVKGWIDAGYPASWYYIYTDNGQTFGCHRWIGQVERLFYVKGDKVEWINHDAGGDPGRRGFNIPERREWMA